MTQSLEDIKKLVDSYSNLTSLEFLVSGICIGKTSISPKTILKFVAGSKLLQDSRRKFNFLHHIMQTELGKAKALINQLSIYRSYPPPPPPSSIHNPCNICKKDIEIEDIDCLDTCPDIFHKKCINTYLEKKIQLGSYPIKCPNCFTEIKSVNMKNRVSANHYKQIEKAEIESVIRINDDLYECPFIECKEKFLIKNKNSIKHKCPNCNKYSCIKCRVMYNDGHSCEEFKSFRCIKKSDIRKGKAFDSIVEHCTHCKKLKGFCKCLGNE